MPRIGLFEAWQKLSELVQRIAARRKRLGAATIAEIKGWIAAGRK